MLTKHGSTKRADEQSVREREKFPGQWAGGGGLAKRLMAVFALFNPSKLCHAKRLRNVIFAVFSIPAFLFPIQAYSDAHCWCKISDGINGSGFQTWSLATYTNLERLSGKSDECSTLCKNQTSDLLSNYSRLCGEVIKSTYPASTSIGAFSDVGAGDYKQTDGGVGSSFPGCTQECITATNGPAIGCATYPTGQPPTPLINYPPTQITGEPSGYFCNESANLTANPPAPSGYDYQWYRNGALLLGQGSQILPITNGGHYQAAYVKNGVNLGLSQAVNVKQCPQGTVWHDVDGDGLREVGEPLLKDVIIEIDTANAEPAGGSKVNTTDANGKYSFPSSIGGTNIWIADSNPLYIFGAPLTKPTGDFSYVDFPTYEDFDFGLKLPASISGTVWEDTNCNGVKDGNESGRPWTVSAKNGGVYDGIADTSGKYTDYVNFSGTWDVYVKPASIPAGEGWFATFPTNAGAHHSVVTKDEFDTITGKDFGYKKLLISGVEDRNVLPFEFPYTLPTPKINGAAALNGTFTWKKGNSTGPQTAAITTAPDGGIYWLDYSESSPSMCKTRVSMEILEKTAQGSWDTMNNYYCIFGDANNKPYSWKLEDATNSK